MKSCKIFLLLLLFFTAFADAYSIQYPARDTVYVERGTPSHIVVARGCFEKTSLLVKKLAKMKRKNSC